MKTAGEAVTATRQAYADLREYSGTPAYLATVAFLTELEEMYAADLLECSPDKVERLRHAARTIGAVRKALLDRSGKTSFIV